MVQVQVRRAVRDDLPALRDIEWASGQWYGEYGLDRVADDEPASVEVLAEYADDGRSWVAIDDANRPIGYILVDIIDGGGHIEQVTVEHAHQGKGVGRALIEPAKRWTKSRGLSAITLTTFGHIPWNRPLYEHLGFRVFSPDEVNPVLQALRETEAHHGLDPELRVVMHFAL